MEGITGSRSSVQTEDNGWFGRTCFFNALVTLIEHSLYLTPCCSGNYNITDTQRTIRHQNSAHIAASFVKTGLNDTTCCLTVRISFQVEHLCFKEYLLQQFINAHTFLGRNLLTLILTSPLFYQQVHVGQVLTYLIRVSPRLINLVDGKHHWHIGSLSMGDCLLRGRHHRVVGSNNDNGNIRYLGTTGTHSCKGLVTWSIKEGDASAILQFHIIGTNVLRDTTCLTGNHVGITDMVKQRSLTMVYVTHHRYDRSAADEVVLVVSLLRNGILHLGTHILGSETELLSNDIDGLGIQTLVDTYHDTDGHTGTDDLIDTDIHHGSQLADSHKLCQFQHFALCCLCCHLLAQALLNGITLLTTVFGTFLILILRSQTGQCLLYLTGYCLIVNLQRLDRTVFLVLLTATLLLAVIEVLVTTFVLVFLALLLVGLISCSFNIHLSATDTLTFLALTVSLMLGCCLLLTLLATLLL